MPADKKNITIQNCNSWCNSIDMNATCCFYVVENIINDIVFINGQLIRAGLCVYACLREHTLLKYKLFKSSFNITLGNLSTKLLRTFKIKCFLLFESECKEVHFNWSNVNVQLFYSGSNNMETTGMPAKENIIPTQFLRRTYGLWKSKTNIATLLLSCVIVFVVYSIN